MNRQLTKSYLLQEYIEKKRSTYDIAIECNTYPNRIRRALIHNKIPLRDKSDAQSAAIQTGRHKHPTKGHKRSENTRIKISEGVAKAWQVLDDVEKEKRIELAKKQWEEMPEDQKERFRKLAAEAVRRAADEGSKLERFLLVELEHNQYQVVFHKSNIVSRERLQVDLYLPELRVAIEIDGPSHFFPIWGEESLSKHIAADYAKTGLLLAEGFVVIRIKNLAKNISKIQCRNLLTNLLRTLECIKTEYPPESKRLIEIELK